MLSILRSSTSLLGRSSILGNIMNLSAGSSHMKLTAVYNSHRRLSSHQSKDSQHIILDPTVEWAKMSKESMKSEQLPRHPYSGRSVMVFNNNLADAFKRLDGILGRNKVRAQVRQDERHEQKGAKRRRLSSQRWRKRFAHEVRLKVQLVQKIRRRGA